MDKYRAEQLEKRINREASYLVTLLKDVSVESRSTPLGPIPSATATK